MKKIVYAVLATVSGLVLLFSYRTSLEVVEPIAASEPAAGETATTTPTTGDAGSSSGSDSSTGTTSGTAGGSSDATSSGAETSTSGLTDGTFTGAAADTRYGPVQVQITVSGGRIADVQVIDYPDSDHRDQEINQRAIPILVSETTQAQSSQIDMVSGATYTSDGYIASLQSAIDQANA
ncbi:Uncharacterized protein, contains FMN-binding domain [Microbacterium sp. cf046]|uniref:FMN-binding protein n=1 Tax=Microbacterium sp. cf046 TaxID=1761803 RepID=UPI0008EA5C12|nr:FMN-binding protein [Microbacterium sp. cf046]SFS03656.1 Uncharacterized protein, contains FMN-binding domain [Microbacterium sp. cf046]